MKNENASPALQNEKPSRKRWSTKSVLLQRLLIFVAGATVAATFCFVHDKANLMDGRSPTTRLKQLLGVARSIGTLQLRSSEWKVERLHMLIGDPDLASDTNEAARLVASIIIDGRSCNQYLMRYIDSRVSLPGIVFFQDFRLANLNGPNIGIGLEDEQGLVLWVLARINAARLLPSLDLPVTCGSMGDESCRRFLVEQWKYEFH